MYQRSYILKPIITFQKKFSQMIILLATWLEYSIFEDALYLFIKELQNAQFNKVGTSTA